MFNLIFKLFLLKKYLCYLCENFKFFFYVNLTMNLIVFHRFSLLNHWFLFT